mgnify:CR=1 FL=1
MKFKKYLLVVFSLGLLTACEDYIDINKTYYWCNRRRTGSRWINLRTQLMEMQQRVIPIGSQVKQLIRVMIWQLQM